MKATVYKSTGSWYVTKTDDGEAVNARIKGVFKIDGITSTNPVAVGDIVELEREPEGDTAMITEIYPRRNYITRVSPSHKMQHHIVAANVDQSMIFATLREPRTSQGFIDRFLVTSEAYHVPAIVVFNKTDLYKKKDELKLEELSRIYTDVGYKVFATSVTENQGLDEIKTHLTNKTTLMSGHSGVGKSSFINKLFPSFNLKTRDVSDWSGKGMHTTTFAEMFDLPGGGRIIDTPGMREFGIVDMSRQELSHYFPEMRALLQDCHFNDCLHINEPGCAIKKAVEDGRIDEGRYVSYFNILETLESKY
ncbi:MAG: ribosome small subunit-dependent GTPase A [Chitinophagaceae bacterium]|nr:ribosome small subunit-dependent GTPase A [Chitinophagaceae bacterium]